jgi:hypothetical protein
MTEPTNAYIATPSTPDEIARAGGFGGEGRGYTTFVYMYLNPSEAIRDSFEQFGKFAGEDTELHVYQIDLADLDGVWPRVNPRRFNDDQLQWSCEYSGKIPASALHWINSITKKHYDAVGAYNEKLASVNGW